MSIPDLTDKWVLITGSASGIGFETALAFAHAGANLVICDINEMGLAPLQAHVQALGRRCLSQVLDVADEAAVQALAQALAAEIGPLDVLVNNAGVAYLGPFLHTPTTAWRRILDVNVMGVLHCCQAFVPGMVAADGPRHVVNVASGAGITPGPNLSAYSASKHAVMGLSDALSLELAGKGVGVTVVCPGIINTPIVSNLNSVSPMIKPEQIARLQRYYQTVGAHPSLVGERIVQAVQRGQELVLVGPVARSMFHLKRLSRRLMRIATIWDSRRNGYL